MDGTGKRTGWLDVLFGDESEKGRWARKRGKSKIVVFYIRKQQYKRPHCFNVLILEFCSSRRVLRFGSVLGF